MKKSKNCLEIELLLKKYYGSRKYPLKLLKTNEVKEEFSKMLFYLFEMHIIILNLWEFLHIWCEKKQGRCHKTVLNQFSFVIF